MNKEKSLVYYVLHFLWLSLLITCLLFGAIWFFTRDLSECAVFKHFNYTQTGQIGDTIGGISSPIVAIIGAGLTFLAFLMQYLANQKYFNQFQKEEMQRERDKFDNQLEKLIAQNRKIVESISINGLDSNKSIELMCDELKYAYLLTKKYYSNTIGDKDALSLSFILFYYGVGSSQNKLIKEIFSKLKTLDGLLNMIDEVKKMYVSKQWPIDDGRDPIAKLFTLDYKPFDGHQARLGHYFRSFFHILTYAEKFGKKKIDSGIRIYSDKDLYEKVKVIRTQMSTHEQLMIFLNSQSKLGKPLIDKKFIVNYKLIKNIPLPLIDYISEKPDWFNEMDTEWKQIVA